MSNVLDVTITLSRNFKYEAYITVEGSNITTPFPKHIQNVKEVTGYLTVATDDIFFRFDCDEDYFRENLQVVKEK